MLPVVLMQLVATVICSAIAGLIVGLPGFYSALLGGLCCVVPNGLFALRLYIAAQMNRTVSPNIFFVGEFVKLGVTAVALWAVVHCYHDVNVLALVAAFIVVLKSYIILLFRH